MKIPDSIRIGGIEYPIDKVSNLRDGNKILYGQIDYDSSQIHMSDTDCKSHDMLCVVLWHEILHGIANHSGLEIKNEETIIEMFSKGIYQVLQDNGARLFDLKEDMHNA